MGTLKLVTAGMGSLGGAKWKNGDIEPGRTRRVPGYLHCPKEGISWWPEG